MKSENRTQLAKFSHCTTNLRHWFDNIIPVHISIKFWQILNGTFRTVKPALSAGFTVLRAVTDNFRAFIENLSRSLTFKIWDGFVVPRRELSKFQLSYRGLGNNRDFFNSSIQ